MSNPNQTSAKSLAELRAQRKRAEQRQKAKDQADSKALRKKYKSKKKPK